MILEGFNMERILTLYEWSLNFKIEIYEIDDIDRYMKEEISYTQFKEFISKHKYKENVIPSKPETYLELRMYGFVPYNISPTQQGIQFGHALQEYNNLYFNNPEDGKFNRWREEHKTFIILNGGTSNEGHKVRQNFSEVNYRGSMQEHLDFLLTHDIRVGTFYEPDLNSMLSAIVFLVDERVFNKKDYPDFKAGEFSDEFSDEERNKFFEEEGVRYNKWIEKVGGEKNIMLRSLLSNKKLA